MYDDLITLAELLAKLDTGKPKQANLRRAVSTVYYALFHCLVEEACCAQFGSQHSQKGYRHAVGRAFTHVVMKQACVSFEGGTLKNSVIKGLPRDVKGNYHVPKPLQEIAALFVELQEKRHLADYDLSERFNRSEVLKLIDEAKAQVEGFLAMPTSDDRKFFLACLWAWKELVSR